MLPLLSDNIDYGFSPCALCFNVSDGFGDLGKRVAPIDNRYYLAAFKKLVQKKQIVALSSTAGSTPGTVLFA